MQLENANKVVGWLAVGSLIGIAVFGLFSFFKMPAYQEGVNIGLKAMVEVFTFAAGVKSGLAISNKQ